MVGDLLGRDEEGVVGTAWSSLLACRTRSRKVGEGWRVPVGVEALAGLEKERDLEGVTVAAVAVEEVGGRCGMAPSIVEVGGVTVLAFKSSRRCVGTITVNLAFSMLAGEPCGGAESVESLSSTCLCPISVP